MRQATLIRNCVWGIGTFGLALALGLPGVSNAVDDSNGPGAAHSIRNPSVTVNGVELSVSTADPATRPSDQSDPAKPRVVRLVVHALNRTSDAAKANFAIAIYSEQPVNVASRVPATPKRVWSASGLFTLNGSESRTIEFTSPPLANSGLIMVGLGSGNPGATMIPVLTLMSTGYGPVAQAK